MSLFFPMEFSHSLHRFDICAIYRAFCEIKSWNFHSSGEKEKTLNDNVEKMRFSREAMAQLSKIVNSSFSIRVSILDELQKLMASLNTMGDFSQFTNFYEFVYFMCRENGQKNIISRAIAAWKLVLAGRFRLLNQWCDFVEENQRYNISEDTWREVLAFSRCVHEDLEGYDPEGAWPLLIDDFVEHMYRITGSNNGGSYNPTCSCGDLEVEASINEELLPGLKKLPGFKRKFDEDLQGNDLAIYRSIPSGAINSTVNFKRGKQKQHNSQLHSSKSPCAIEGCLSKGFSGLFSSLRMQKEEQKGAL